MQNFHSGFSLENESGFFKELLLESPYIISGFSYGAIKAFEMALEYEGRIDKLILLSPAFFQTKSESFKKLQLRAYKANSKRYLNDFLKSCFVPYEPQELQEGLHSIEDLEKLLYYEWEQEKIEHLLKRGIEIEVHLGLLDAIVDVESARTFFTPLATVYSYTKANHFLLGETLNE